MSTPVPISPESTPTQDLEVETPPRNRLRVFVLSLGAILFIFPFY